MESLWSGNAASGEIIQLNRTIQEEILSISTGQSPNYTGQVLIASSGDNSVNHICGLTKNGRFTLTFINKTSLKVLTDDNIRSIAAIKYISS